MGIYFRGVLIFVVSPHTSYLKVLCMCLHSKTYNLSMVSSFIYATKERRQHTKPPMAAGTDLRLNTETNKLESVVSMCGVIPDVVTWSR